MKPAVKTNLWTFAIVAVAISPFWFLAADTTDGDERDKTAVSLGMVAVIKAIHSMLGTTNAS